MLWCYVLFIVLLCSGIIDILISITSETLFGRFTGVDPAHSPPQAPPNGDSKEKPSLAGSDDQFFAIQLCLDDLHRGDWCWRFEHEELVKRFGRGVLESLN